MQKGFGGQVCVFKGVECLFDQVKGWKWNVCCLEENTMCFYYLDGVYLTKWSV